LAVSIILLYLELVNIQGQAAVAFKSDPHPDQRTRGQILETLIFRCLIIIVFIRDAHETKRSTVSGLSKVDSVFFCTAIT
jgi:hypothetical protein